MNSGEFFNATMLQLEIAQQQIAALADKERDQSSNCDSIVEQLQKTQGNFAPIMAMFVYRVDP